MLVWLNAKPQSHHPELHGIQSGTILSSRLKTAIAT